VPDLPNRPSRNALMRIARLVDSRPRLKGKLVCLASTLHKRRGTALAIVTEVTNLALQRPVHLSLQTLGWARSLETHHSARPGFRPDLHLHGTEATAAGQALLRHAHDNNVDNAKALELQRQTALLDRQDCSVGEVRPEVLEMAERQLRAALDAKADQPPARVTALPEGSESMCEAVVATLRDAGLEPFLVSGSLLGAVRLGAALPGDYDIDLGLLPGASTTEIVARLFVECHDYSTVIKGECVVLRHTSGFTIDVFLHFERDGRWWHATDIHEWWNTPFELEAVPFGRTNQLGPAPADLYLTENYGNWQTPAIFFQVPFDTPNHQFVRSEATVISLLDQGLDAIKTSDRFMTTAALTALHDEFDIDLLRYLPRPSACSSSDDNAE